MYGVDDSKRKDFVLRTDNFNIYFNNIEDWTAFLDHKNISKRAFPSVLSRFKSGLINKKKRSKYINEFNRDIYQKLNYNVGRSGRMLIIKELNDISLDELKNIFESLHLSLIVKKESKNFDVIGGEHIAALLLGAVGFRRTSDLAREYIDKAARGAVAERNPG